MRDFLRILMAGIVAGGLAGCSKPAAPPAKPVAAKPQPAKPAGTNAPALTNAVIARSIFIVPTNPQVEGLHNPFFPQSTLGSKMPRAVEKVEVVDYSDIEVTGIQMLPRPFAVINGRGFEIGQRKYLTSKGTTVAVQCTEIHTNSATVIINGKYTRELVRRPPVHH